MMVRREGVTGHFCVLLTLRSTFFQTQFSVSELAF